MTAEIVYLDASAIVKLIIPEAQTEALVAYLAPAEHFVTSRVSAVEVKRAAARRGIVDIDRLEETLARIEIRELDDEVARRAAELAPATLRTLDAIHLASAIELRGERAAFVSYDQRLAEAARLHGLLAMAPA